MAFLKILTLSFGIAPSSEFLKWSSIIQSHFYNKLCINVQQEHYCSYIQSTFKNVSKRNSTELSKHVWNLKDKNIDFKIKWTILHKSKPYNNKSIKCHLCLLEKYYIIYKPELGILNKRNKLASSYRHKALSLYKNCKFWMHIQIFIIISNVLPL